MTVALGELTGADVRAAAALHRVAFPDFFLSRLGTPFLIQLYAGFVDDASAVTVKATDDRGVLRGVVVGTVEPEGFFGRLLRRHWRGLVLASARAAVVDPRSLSRLVRAVRYRGDGPAGSDGALLSSLCVDPVSRGRGLGQLLVDRWLAELAVRRVTTAFLTTDAEGNEAVNRFYRSRNWQLVGSYTTPAGRPMNQYRFAVEGHPC